MKKPSFFPPWWPVLDGPGPTPPRPAYSERAADVAETFFTVAFWLLYLFCVGAFAGRYL